MDFITSPKNFPTFTSDFSCENTETIEMTAPEECLHYKTKSKLYGHDKDAGFYEYALYCEICGELLRIK